jgi:GAF domain-containing protein
MNDSLRMHEELRRAGEAMSQHRTATSRLISNRCSEEFADVSQQNADLVNLHVASTRIHESAARHEVLTAIQEIVINLIGSEQIGVLEIAPDGRTMSLVSSFGIEEERYASIPVGVGIIGRVALTGEPYLTGGDRDDDPRSGEEPTLSACVPLKVCGRIVGVLVVFQLLRHKPVLRELDYRLLEIVSTQAAPALYCARAFEQ